MVYILRDMRDDMMPNEKIANSFQRFHLAPQLTVLWLHFKRT